MPNKILKKLSFILTNPRIILILIIIFNLKDNGKLFFENFKTSIKSLSLSTNKFFKFDKLSLLTLYCPSIFGIKGTQIFRNGAGKK